MTDRCPTTWPRQDGWPANAHQWHHRCHQARHHRGPHRCPCGDVLDPFEQALAQAIAAKPSHLNKDTE